MRMRSGSIHRFSLEKTSGQETSDHSQKQLLQSGNMAMENLTVKAKEASGLDRAMNFQDLNDRLADMKQGLTQTVEAGMGEIFIELSKLYGEMRIRADVYQELARLRAENAAMEQRHLEDVARIQLLKARLKDCRKENRSPRLRRISA